VLLARAEKAFRDVKWPLAERPIFPSTRTSVEAHISLCVLAYHLVRIELDQNIHTWATLRGTLKTHQTCTIVLLTNNGSGRRVGKASRTGSRS